MGTELREKIHRVPNIDNPNRLSAKLAGLKPDTKYRIQINAKTSKGEGEGYYIEYRTGNEAEAIGAVAKPQFHWTHEQTDRGGAASTIRVYWRPNVEGEGWPGSHFYVQYR